MHGNRNHSSTPMTQMTGMARAIIPIVAALARLTAAESIRQEDHNAQHTWVETTSLIPFLIVVAATILSLEIFDVTLLSRPLAAVTMAGVWGGFLSEHLRLSSLLAAIICHGVQEVYAYRSGGLQRGILFETARRASFWASFWLRVVVWGATLATTRAIFKTKTLESSAAGVSLASTVVLVRTSLWYGVYSMCAEVLVSMYLSSTHINYEWRPRKFLILASCSIGFLQATGALPLAIAWLQHRVSSVQLVIALVVLMWISLRLPWPHLIDQTKRVVGSITSAIHPTPENTSAVENTSKRRRSSILYHSTSDVEVVEMTAEFHPYDLRNNDTGHHHFS